MAIHPSQTVQDVTCCFPSTGRAFLRRRMGCLGCVMAPFDTLGEVAAVYGLDLPTFVAELECLAGAAGRGRARFSRVPGWTPTLTRSAGRTPRGRRRASPRKEAD